MKFKLFIFLILTILYTFTLSSQESSCDLIVKGVDSMMDGRYAKSLELLTKAWVIAEEEAEEENVYANLFVAINNIGLNYHKLLDNNEALEYYLESYTIAIKELDYSYEMTNNLLLEKQLKEKETHFLLN